MNFSEFNLDPSLKSAIKKLNYEECTPVQELSIPVTLEGKDVAGLAQTGTGKTAAFLLPIMERILRARPLAPDTSEEIKALAAKRAFPDWKPQNFILILVPTRELAEQVHENVEKLSEFSGLRGFAIYGGTGYDKQKEALKNGVEFIVATPGRLIDLYKEHLVDLKQVRAIIFDEADRMFDMGFKDDMKYILQRVPKERQFLVFSATLNFDVLNTAYQFGADPVEVNISRDSAKAENVKDEIFHVGQDEKAQYLLSLLKLHKPRQAIIFTNFKVNVEKITRFLNDNGIPAMAISSLLTQVQRTKVMQQFKAENDLNILVATDVAARGLDVQGVDMVVNFELPMDCESYVHRIGRTGRAGADGIAFSLVSDRDVDSLARIEDYLKHKIEVGYLEDNNFIKDFKPFIWSDSSYSRPYESRSGSGGGGGGGTGRGRQDRGPRAGSSDRRSPPRTASAGEAGRGPRREGRTDVRKEASHSGQRREAGRDQRPDQRRGRPKQVSQGNSQAQKPQAHHVQRGPKKPYAAHVAKQKSIGQRVTGFIKKLFS